MPKFGIFRGFLYFVSVKNKYPKMSLIDIQNQ